MNSNWFKKYKMSAEDAANLINDSMNVAMSGYSAAGYPKAIVRAIRQRKLADNISKINLITGANVPFIDEQLGSINLINRRAPMIAHKSIRSYVNNDDIKYCEQQMNKMPRLLQSNSFGSIDILIIESAGFDKQGNIIPSNSIGMINHLIKHSKKIIVEINISLNEKIRKLHDIYQLKEFPNTEPIPLTRSNQRIGTNSIPFNHDKLIAVVENNEKEISTQLYQSTLTSEKITSNLFNFLEIEYKRLKGLLPPIQTGFGAISDSITNELNNSNFKDINFFCGGIGESALNLLETGKAKSISTGGLGLNENVERILSKINNIEDILVIRNGDITNSSEIINRLSLIALNTGIEIDIYGNVNSSHVSGNRVINGIGGGANFAQNSGLSIILIPSISKGDAISNIVPMVSHQDICEHDVDVIISENGIADVRGLDDRERAMQIINNCSSPQYKELLKSYFQKAIKSVGGHHPQIPLEAYKWHSRLKETGSMKEV